MIDWTKLTHYRGYQHKSFEELCYQIAEGLFAKEGIFSNIADSGGGDGVEFFLTLRNTHDSVTIMQSRWGA